MDSEYAELRSVFRGEVDDCLSTMEGLLVDLEVTPEQQTAVAELFRAVHTLKGSGASMGFDGLARVAHAFEDVLDALRDGRLAIQRAVVSLLLDGIDALRTSAAAGFAEHHELDAGQLDVIARARRMLDLAVQTQGGRLLEPTHVATAAAAQGTPPPASPSWDTLRVSRARLDRMLALVGQIAIANSRVEVVLQRSAGPAAEALEAYAEAHRWQQELRDLVLQVRMLPLGSLFRQQARTVRDLCVSSGKKARLTTAGEGVEIDASILEQAREAMLHLVRNAVDHGIETPEARVADGKDPVGLIQLSARQDGGYVVIEVADDGRGLDPTQILQKARARGLVGTPEPVREEDVFELLFRSGFSTADAVTRTSGRGVGLDVVQRCVERLRGTVRMDGAPGAGARVTLRLPLTVSVVDGLRLDAAGHTWVVPISDVAECFDAPYDEGGRSRLRDRGILSYRGRGLPYVRLRRVLGIGSADVGRESVVVVRSHGGNPVGIAVDGILGTTPAVVEPVSSLATAPPLVGGCTLQQDGRVALVMNASAFHAYSEGA